MHRSQLHALALSAALLLAAPSHALSGGSPTTAFGHLGTVGSNGLDGILIAPNWVLTAAHVAHSSSTFQSAYGSAAIDAAYVAPGAAFPSHDIALLHLATPLDAPLFPTLNATLIDSASARTGAQATAAAAANGGQMSLAYTTLVDAFDTADGDNGGQLTVWYIAVCPASNNNALLQGGDSGGSLFAGQADDSTGLLIGIASASDGQHSYFVQPGAYRAWLDSTIATSGQSAAWSASPVPEPAPALLWLGALPLLIAGARHRWR
jgi:hypothetical protein